MNKLAFLTMDVESYFDTSCLKNTDIDRDQKYNCAEEVLTFAKFLSKNDIKGTFFVTKKKWWTILLSFAIDLWAIGNIIYYQ